MAAAVAEAMTPQRPEEDWARRRRPWRRWRHHQWVEAPAAAARCGAARRTAWSPGLAAGIAARTGVDVTLVRLVFVVAALLGGFGVAAYVAGWLLLPAEGADGSIANRALNDRRGLALAAWPRVAAHHHAAHRLRGRRPLAQLGGVGAGRQRGRSHADLAEHPTGRARGAPPPGRSVLGLAGAGRRRRPVLRIVAAVLLLIIGLAALLSGRAAHALLAPLAGLLLVIIAIVIMLGPWWLRIARRPGARAAGPRPGRGAGRHGRPPARLGAADARADPAPRRPDPQQVIQLARAQERELRSWLFDGLPPGSADGQGMTSGRRRPAHPAGGRGPARDHRRDAVTVGDCELDDDLSALLAAAREATVNAAKWSGAPAVVALRRGRAGRGGRCSCGTAGAASTRRRCPVTARAWPSRSAPGSPGTGARSPSAALQVRAPRCR